MEKWEFDFPSEVLCDIVELPPILDKNDSLIKFQKAQSALAKLPIKRVFLKIDVFYEKETLHFIYTTFLFTLPYFLDK